MARRVVVVLGAPGRRVDGATLRHASATSSATVILAPLENPIVGAVISGGHTPPVQHWKAADGSFCIIDGEILNVGDIPAERPESNTARLVFDLFERYGLAGLAKLDAAASIIIWDARRNELTVARDQTGSVPVFTTTHDGCFYAASDLFSLVETGVDRTIDLRSLDYFLGHGFSPAPWSYVASIAKIPASHLIRVMPGREPKLLSYGQDFAPWSKKPQPAECLDQIRHLLCQAIERRRSRTSKTGVLLSGGVDSALLLACLTRDCGAPSEAFTFRYGHYDGVFNESEEARKIAAHFGVAHYVLECSPHDLAANIPRLVRDYGEPFTYGLHSFLLGEIKRAGVTSVLSGIGSDGYNVDDSGLASIAFNRLPRILRNTARLGVGMLKPLVPALDRKAYAILWSDRTGLPSAAYPPNMRDEARRDLYSEKSWFDQVQHETLALARESVDQLKGRSDIDVWRVLNHAGFDSECMLFWNTAWARKFDIELRYPFFDIDLKDYVMQASPGGKGKQLFREIAATMMPLRNAKAPKIPQTIPIGHWFRGPLREVVLDYLAPPRIADLFDTRVVLRMIDEHLSGRVDHTWRLWSLISFTAWREEISKVTVLPTVSAPEPRPRLSEAR
jgi:asparagine synthase (glutamine-hydrolysing)